MRAEVGRFKSFRYRADYARRLRRLKISSRAKSIVDNRIMMIDGDISYRDRLRHIRLFRAYRARLAPAPLALSGIAMPMAFADSAAVSAYARARQMPPLAATRRIAAPREDGRRERPSRGWPTA